MKGEISPPPLKRRNPAQVQHLTTANEHLATTPRFTPLSAPTPGCLRIFSWNVNGIAPFVQPYLQKSIKSFFKPSIPPPPPTAVTGTKRKRQRHDDVTDDSGDEEAREEDVHVSNSETDELSQEGAPSLRLVLQRYDWPHILFLQEIKIKPGDSKTIDALGRAVNDVLESRSDDRNQGAEFAAQLGTTQERVQLLTDGGPAYEVHVNLPSDPYNARGFGGKVYGVATIVRKDFVSSHVLSIRKVPWDREGRIQVIETREIALPLDSNNEMPWHVTAKDQKDPRVTGHKFAIINIYAVNGTSNPYRSTQTGVEVGTRHDRKLAVHTELLLEARSLEAQGFQVIIAGDLNIARSELDGHPNLRTRPYQHVLNRADFNKKFFSGDPVDMRLSKAAYQVDRNVSAKSLGPLGFNGIDTFRHVHNDLRRYSYHSRGIPWGSSCDRVDLIIASRSLAENVVNAGIYDSPKDRGPSDHCPIWVEIGLEPNTDGKTRRLPEKT